MGNGPTYQSLPVAFKLLADRVEQEVWQRIRRGDRVTTTWPLLRTYREGVFLVVDVISEFKDPVRVKVPLDLNTGSAERKCTPG